MDEKTMLALAGVYSFYDKELSDFAAEVWSQVLDEYDQVAVRAAFQRHLRDPEAGRFLPKPADIVRQLSGAADDQALMAWGRVIGSFKGGDRPSDAITKQAIDAMGGWDALGRASEAENSWLQKRFLELFSAYKRREEIEQGNVRQIGAMVANAVRIAK